MNATQTVAQTIIEQLGGRRFQVMTGASFTYDSDSVIIKLGRGARQSIKAVKVRLAGDDTYTMTFYSQARLAVRVVAEHAGVYCDMLQSIFTEETGLHTSL